MEIRSSIAGYNPVNKSLTVFYVGVLSHEPLVETAGAVSNIFIEDPSILQDTIRLDTLIKAHTPVHGLVPVEDFEFTHSTVFDSADVEGAKADLVPAETPEQAKQRMRNEVADARYHVEISGTYFQGISIPTDRNTQAILTAMRIKAAADPDYTVNFKVGSVFVEMDATMIIAVSDAVHDHVQRCFNKENDLLILIENGEEVSAEDFVLE